MSKRKFTPIAGKWPIRCQRCRVPVAKGWLCAACKSWFDVESALARLSLYRPTLRGYLGRRQP